MVRFGILGFGLHAVKRLMPGFELAKNAKVTALSRRDSERAKQSAREFGIPLAFTSAEDLCRCRDVDAIFVASPNSFHLPHVLTALLMGKPVLVEKPMGLNADECRQMVEAGRRTELPLGVAQVFRFEDSVQRIRERVTSGEIGRVVLARAEFSFWGRKHARTWMNDPRIGGGGPIADVGVHCIDTLRFILGDEVASVSAHSHSDNESGQVEAAGSLVLQFRSGTLASVMVSTRAEYRTPLEIIGENGFLRAENGLSVDEPVMLQVWRGSEAVDAERVSNHLAYARQVDAFAAAVEGKSSFPVAGEEGWRNQLVLDGAYQSIRSGRRETIVFPKELAA